MITVKNTIDKEVVLQFEGEDIILKPDTPITLTPEAAKFVLDTLAFCEKTEVKKEVSVPKIPVVEEVIEEPKEEEVTEEEPKKKKTSKK